MAIPNRFEDASDNEWPSHWRELTASSASSSPVKQASKTSKASAASKAEIVPAFEGFDPSVAASLASMSARPGNAFAQRKELEKQQKLQESSTMKPTVKEDVSIRPEVPPKNTPNAVTTELALPMPKSRPVQPITPLVTQGDKNKAGRERRDSSANAATEPEVKHPSAMPEALFHDNENKEGKDPKLKAAKGNKYWLKDNKKGKKNENVPTTSEKAAKVLGGSPSPPKKEPESTEDNHRGYRRILPKSDNPPFSAPPKTEPPEYYRSSIDSTSTERDVSPARQVQSHPGPASKRYHLENMGPNTPTIIPWGNGMSSESQAADAEGNGDEHATPKLSQKSSIQGMMLGDPSTSPTRQGTYGKVANVELHTHPSVASMRGIIVDDGPASHMKYVPSVESFNSGISGPRHAPSMTMLQPTVYQPGPYYPLQQPYSPSVYEGPGPWEEMRNNHPDSMPPFTPTNLRFSQGSSLGPGPIQPYAGDRAASTRSYPIMFQGQPSEITPTESRPHSTTYGGFAPTPNHPDFQPTGGQDDRLAFQFTTMQFHLDSEFRKLAMQVTDAKDETVDKVIRRINGVETKLQSSVGSVIKEVKEVTQVMKVSTDSHSPPQVNEAVQKLNNITKNLESALDDLKESIMNRPGPLVVDGTVLAHKKKQASGNAAVTMTPERSFAAASVPTPMAAYPTPAHDHVGYNIGGMGPIATVLPPNASSLDPNAFTFTPGFTNMPANFLQPANVVQPSHSAVGLVYDNRLVPQDVRSSSGSSLNAPMPNLTRRPSDFNNNANYQNQGHYNQSQQGRGQARGQDGYYNRNNNRRGNDDFHRQPRGGQDYRNISTNTAIHVDEPEPDIRYHPAFAKSASDMSGFTSPRQNNSFNQAIPAVGTETASAHTSTGTLPGGLWSGHTQNLSGGNWYNQAYGGSQTRGYPPGDIRYVDDKEKRLYNWAPAGTQAYMSHREPSWEVESGNDGSKQQSQALGTHGRKDSQSRSQTPGNNYQGQSQRNDQSQSQNQPSHRQPGSAAFPHGPRKDLVTHSPAKNNNGEGKSGGPKGKKGGWKNKGVDPSFSSSAAA